MIRAVIFDFGNVICRFDPKIFVRGIAPFSTMPVVPLGTVLMNSSDLFLAYESGRISSPVFFERISSRCGISCTQEQFIAAFSSIFTPNVPVFDLVRSLKQRYRLGLLSNTSEWHFQHGIRPTEIFPLFDTVTLSFEVGAMKPAEEIYRDALKKLGRVPDECAYIDDIREYADAASSIGMHGLHYTGHSGLLQRLTEIGIRF